jgi:Domain of unknown function (DUF6538)
MAKYPYLTRSGKRGMWCFRRSVPPRLRPFIGKREVVCSLRTAQLTSEALLDYHVIAAETEEAFERAMLELRWSEDEAAFRAEEAAIEAEGGYADITAMVAAGFHLEPKEQCRLHYQRCKSEEAKFRSEMTRRAKEDPEAFWRGELIELPMNRQEFYSLSQFASLRENGEGYMYLLGMAYRTRLEKRLSFLRTVLLTQDFTALGVTIGCCETCAGKMGLAFAHVEIELTKELLADDAALLPSPVDIATALRTLPGTQKPHADPQTAIADSGPALTAAVAEWIDASTTGKSAWNDERRALCQRVMRDFIEICGDKPLAAYRKSDGHEFVKLLRRLPPNLDKRKRKLGLAGANLRELADAASVKGLRARTTPTSTRRLASSISVSVGCGSTTTDVQLVQLTA